MYNNRIYNVIAAFRGGGVSLPPNQSGKKALVVSQRGKNKRHLLTITGKAPNRGGAEPFRRRGTGFFSPGTRKGGGNGPFWLHLVRVAKLEAGHLWREARRNVRWCS